MRERVVNPSSAGTVARTAEPRVQRRPDFMPAAPSDSSAHVLLMLHRAATGEPRLQSSDVDALVRALERSKLRVTVSKSPVDSKRLLATERPSVIVLDPLVNTADGIEFELIARVQNDEDPIPLLFLVPSIRELGEFRRIDALFKDFIVRPFTSEEIEHRIEAALSDKQRFLEMRNHARKLESEVIRDFKTGLYTERHFRHLLGQEFQRAERHRIPLSFLLLDIDDFKRINDDCEYAFGDHVLTEFAQILLASIREIDHAARFGGDEFMILLPNTSPAEAVQVAGRIRTTLERRMFDDGNYRVQITTSIGIDTYDGRSLSSARDLRRRANLALKEAKTRGKNRIWLFSGARANPGRSEAAEDPESGGPRSESTDAGARADDGTSSGSAPDAPPQSSASDESPTGE